MKKLRRKKIHKIGKPPGVLEFVGDQKTEFASWRSIEYNADTVREEHHRHSFAHSPDPDINQWYDIVGLHDIQLIEEIGTRFKIHPLILEDIVAPFQRPKVEFYDEYIYVVLRMYKVDAETREVSSEQVTLILGEGWLLTFQEMEGDVFEVIRERIRTSGGRVRKMGTDYLAYALIDAIVDHYFLILEEYSNRMEDQEERLLDGASEEILPEIQEMKRRIIALRKSLWPFREALGTLSRKEHPLIERETLLYLADAYDHCIQIIDTVESYREIVGGVQDLYLSVVNNKMNEVMKVLALISTIFLPLGLVAGIYGMNFSWIPELNLPYGYFFALGLMLSIGTGMFFFFKKRKWI